MPHQNVHSSNATAQNQATEPTAPTNGDRPDSAVPAEPRAYAAANVEESTLAPPAAGEVADFMDEGDALAADDVQQGGTHANRPYRTEKLSGQGPKTRQANADRVRGG